MVVVLSNVHLYLIYLRKKERNRKKGIEGQGRKEKGGKEKRKERLAFSTMEYLKGQKVTRN